MNRTVTVMLLGCVAVSTAESEAVAQEREYTIVNEQIEPIPLPFQAAVFRRAFQNRTDKLLPTEYPGYGAGIRKIKGIDADEYRTPRGGITDAGRPSGYWNGLSWAERLVPLSLEPGDQSTICYSFAAEWVAVGTSSTAASLFPEPGTYSFRLYHDDELRLTVHEPRGDDKLIVDQLRADPDLASEMMNAIGSRSEEILRPLARIVKLYPESSYANYARFALARYYANDPSGDLRDVPEDLRIRASVFLSEIEGPFAYAPEALILHHRVLESLRRDELAADVMTTLRQDYADSAELLNYLVQELGHEKWIEENPWRPTSIPESAATSGRP